MTPQHPQQEIPQNANTPPPPWNPHASPQQGPQRAWTPEEIAERNRQALMGGGRTPHPPHPLRSDHRNHQQPGTATDAAAGVTAGAETEAADGKSAFSSFKAGKTCLYCLIFWALWIVPGLFPLMGLPGRILRKILMEHGIVQPGSDPFIQSIFFTIYPPAWGMASLVFTMIWYAVATKLDSGKRKGNFLVGYLLVFSLPFLYFIFTSLWARFYQ